MKNPRNTMIQAGKTVVLAILMLYHFFNRNEYRNDTRFADYFLVITPGITIKNRLGVLFIDTNPYDKRDYYYVRDLAPKARNSELYSLNSKLVITNYHALEQKTLQGNKRTPFDGRITEDGSKAVARENFNQIIKGSLSNFRSRSRLLILNDEAHLCYLPKEEGKIAEIENTFEYRKGQKIESGLLASLGKRV